MASLSPMILSAYTTLEAGHHHGRGCPWGQHVSLYCADILSPSRWVWAHLGLSELLIIPACALQVLRPLQTTPFIVSSSSRDQPSPQHRPWDTSMPLRWSQWYPRTSWHGEEKTDLQSNDLHLGAVFTRRRSWIYLQ